MRLQKKYKVLCKFRSNTVPNKFNSRIFRFKRPKWFRIQKELANQLNKKIAFYNYEIHGLKAKSWGRIKKYFSESIELNRYRRYMFGQYKFISGNVYSSRREFFLSNALKNHFRLDVFLFNLGFFPSILSSHSSILSKKIFLNGKNCSPNSHLHKGDIVEFRDCTSFDCLDISQIYSSKLGHDTFYTFSEIDYYTKTIVITKDLSTISFEDFSWALSDFIDFRNIKFR